MKIYRDLFEQVKKACEEEGRLLSRLEIAKRWNLTEPVARTIRVLLENEELFSVQTKNPTEIRFGVTADVHVGSLVHFEEEFEDFLEFLNNEEVDVLFIAGDLLDGSKVYRGQEFTQNYPSIEDQIAKALEELSVFRGQIYLISGNHEQRTFELTGADPLSSLAAKSRNIHYLGPFRTRVQFGDYLLELFHGSGSTAYAVSYKLQKAIDNYGRDVPHFLLAGHWHLFEYLSYKGVNVFHAGTFQGETDLTRRMGIQVHQLGGWLVEVVGKQGRLVTSVQSITYQVSRTVRTVVKIA